MEIVQYNLAHDITSMEKHLQNEHEGDLKWYKAEWEKIKEERQESKNQIIVSS